MPDSSATSAGNTVDATLSRVDVAPPPHLRTHTRERAASTLVPALVVALSATVMVVYSLGQWRAMTVPSWDLAIFTELAKAYSQFQAPIVPVKGDGYNLLGDHFHPILMLLGPIYRLFPSALSLLITQDLLLAVSAWPLTRLAVRRLGPSAGFALGLTYALSWGIQGAVEAQFHEIAFAIPLLAFMATAFVEQRWRACAAWALPLVLVKEDMGLTVFMIGLAIAWRGLHPTSPGTTATARRRRQPADNNTLIVGAFLAGAGLVAFVLTVFVFLPALNPSGVWAYGLGDGGTEASGNLLTRLFSPEIKLVTLLLVAASMGFIGLRSPLAAVVLPTLAWRFLGSVSFYWDWQHWHYNAVLMPIALGALLDVVARLQERSSGDDAEEPRKLPSRKLTPWVRPVIALGVVAAVAVTPVKATELPLWSLTDSNFGQAPTRSASIEQVLDALPEGSSVNTDLTLMAYLVPEHTVYWVGTCTVATDYVLIDQYSSAWGGNPPQDAAAWAQEQNPGSEYTVILDVDGFKVAKRNS